jgi:putative heme-binding domain-containing protein
MGAASEYYSARALRGPVSRMVRGELDPALALDVLLAAADSDDHRIKEFLASYQDSKDATNPLAPFIETLHGGDAMRGKAVFETSVAAQCTLCHRIGRKGSSVGPPLTKIGQQPVEYLLESLVNPGAVVAMGYGITSVTLQSGEVVAGTLTQESDQTIEVKTADGSVRQIALSDIASRTTPVSSMPPMGALMSRLELRDLLAYLQSLQ